MRASRLLLLTGLTAASMIVTAARGDDSTESLQKAKAFEKEIKITVRFNYLLYLPDGYDAAPGKTWPMIVFLHGGGETGEDVTKVKATGLPKLIENKPDFPFIVVSPQSRGRGWNPDGLNALLDDVTSTYRVDKERIYLTGLSMGGNGTWMFAAEHPERFAAIAPICGTGFPRDAARLKDLPIWVFHGAKDPTVPVKRSEDMVAALKKAGAEKVKFTVYPEAKHDSWTVTYDDPELYKWFLANTRKNANP